MSTTFYHTPVCSFLDKVFKIMYMFYDHLIVLWIFCIVRSFQLYIMDNTLQMGMYLLSVIVYLVAISTNLLAEIILHIEIIMSIFIVNFKFLLACLNNILKAKNVGYAYFLEARERWYLKTTTKCLVQLFLSYERINIIVHFVSLVKFYQVLKICGEHWPSGKN